jgi:hypothetical protein
MAVAVELQGSDVVVGALAPGNRQALAGLHVPDLVVPVMSLICQVRDGWLSQLN